MTHMFWRVKDYLIKNTRLGTHFPLKGSGRSRNRVFFLWPRRTYRLSAVSFAEYATETWKKQAPMSPPNLR
jgi:hypothetical protein